MRAHVGPATKVVDLGGRFVAPGLADGHLHGVSGGPGIDLAETRSLDELFAVVGRAARMRSRAPSLSATATGTRRSSRRSACRLRASSINMRRSIRWCWCAAGTNTCSTRRRSPNGASPSRPSRRRAARSARTKAASSTANSSTTRARLVTLPPLRAPTIDDVLATQRTLNSYGITSVRITGSFRLGEFFHTLDLVLEARKRNLLTLRLNVYLPATRAGAACATRRAVREILARSPLKQDEGDEWVRIGGVKLGVDGGFEGGFMTQPFVGAMGRNGTYFGINTVPAADFAAITRALNQDGWRVTTHAVGDAAIDVVLGGYEAANADRSIAGRRWAIEHLFVSRPDQIARLKKLGCRAVGAGPSLSRGAIAEEISRPGAGKPDHAGEDLSGAGVPGGGRHRSRRWCRSIRSGSSIISSRATRSATASMARTSA